MEVVPDTLPDSWRLNQVSKKLWDDCLVVLKSLHKSIAYDLYCECLSWDPVIISLLRQTTQYANTTEEYKDSLQGKWNLLMMSCPYKSPEIVGVQTEVAENMDDFSELGDEDEL